MFTINPTLAGLDSNPHFCSEMSASNYLRHGQAFCFVIHLICGLSETSGMVRTKRRGGRVTASGSSGSEESLSYRRKHACKV